MQSNRNASEVRIQWKRKSERVPVSQTVPPYPAPIHPSDRYRMRRRCGSLVALATFALGCASPSAPVFDSGDSVSRKVELRSQGMRRSYRMHVPPDATDEPLPVVIVLHGAFSSAEQIERRSGWSRVADEEKFIALYPNGIGLFGMLQHWNAGHCCGKALADDVDDVGFVLDVLEDAAMLRPIDRHRVYVTGFSNGAMLAHRIGAEHAGRFAAIAPVAGANAGRSGPLESRWAIPEPRRPIPVLLVHGREDRVVPWEGSSKGSRQSSGALDSALRWAERNGCETRPERRVNRDGNVEILAFPGCAPGTRVELHSLEGWGHRWPAPFFTAALPEENPLHDFDGTREIWRFFEGFELAPSRTAGLR